MSEQALQKLQSAIAEYCVSEHKFNEFDAANPKVRLHEPTFGSEEIYAATKQMLTTFVTMGKEVKAFEAQYAAEFGNKYAVFNNSGSSANLLAIAALNNHMCENRLHDGDEVIVPALSWSTTVWPLIQCNLVPVFVDCDPATYNFDMNKLEAAITPKTKAIMLVHVYGNPCDMDALMALAKKYNLQVIEDSCESMGAYYKGKAVGTFGRVATFSTYFSHHITTLEGGVTVTDDFNLLEIMRMLRAHGWSRETDEHKKYCEQYPTIDPRFIFVNLGYNLRATEVQAVMGQIQLPKLKGFVKNRRDTVAFYQKQFAKYAEFFDFQQETPGAESSWFGYGFTIKKGTPFNVKEICAFLNSKGIETRPIIAGNMSRHPVMQHYNHKVSGTLENCNNIMDNGFAIGCHHAVGQQARDYVAGAFEEFMKKYSKQAAA
jgi:CDP-6-deoxy-D-xylo-4-hexulose-3-dehydrase